MMSSTDFKEKQIIFVNGRVNEKFAFQNDNLIIKDEEDKIVHQSTCHQLFSLYIIGHFTITSKLLEKAKQFGFSIVLMSYSFHVIETFNNGLNGNYLLHKKQYQYSGLDIGKAIVRNKIKSQRNELQSIRNKSVEMKKAIDNIKYYEDVLMKNEVNDFYVIMSIEGQVAKQYFKYMFFDFEWIGRKPRAKRDPINTVLDIGYTMLFHYIESLLALYDFDAYVGVFHKQFYKRKSLVCDMVEPFRVIIDHEVKKAFKLKQFKEEDFKIINDQYILNIKLNSHYGSVFLNAINKYKNEIFLYVREYYRWFMKGRDIECFPVFNWDENNVNN